MSWLTLLAVCVVGWWFDRYVAKFNYIYRQTQLQEAANAEARLAEVRRQELEEKRGEANEAREWLRNAHRDHRDRLTEVDRLSRSGDHAGAKGMLGKLEKSRAATHEASVLVNKGDYGAAFNVLAEEAQQWS
jgi:hypothetical protein